jgi:hypothetical protein
MDEASGDAMYHCQHSSAGFFKEGGSSCSSTNPLEETAIPVVADSSIVCVCAV